MTLKLDELLKKAKDKGYGASQSIVTSSPSPSHMIKTWQQESVLYSEKIEDKEAEKPNTNRTQTRHKVNTNRTQFIHRKKETEHKLDTQPNTNSDTNRTQTEHKLDTNVSFSSLVGLQRQTLIFLFQDCKVRGARCTQELTIQHIAESLEMPVGSVKTTLSRLEEKKFIKRESFKNGRGGWSRYELPNSVYRELIGSYLETKPNTNRTQTRHKPDTKLNTQPNTNVASSSGININKNTTTSDETNVYENSGSQTLSAEWQEVDISSLANIGFTTTHLIQLAKSNKLPPPVVQDSIYAFAFDLEHNGKAKSIKGSPINLFMGVLRNGQPYTAPHNYESPGDRSMRLYLENKKGEEQRREAMEKELWEIEFKKWSESLTAEEKEQLLPEDIRKLKMTAPKVSYLRTYHRENIWPEIKKEIYGKF